jgi:curli biogenesis system outer membrane secretion channel CsgG
MPAVTNPLAAPRRRPGALATLAHALLATLLSIGMSGRAHAQADAQPPKSPSKIGIAVPTLGVTPAIRSKAAQNGQSSELDQIVQGFDGKIGAALAGTRKFELRVHTDLDRILREQQIQDSGNYDLSDPSRAKGLKLAGIPYLALIKVNDFQDVVKTVEALGNKMRRREIRVSLVCDVVDVTKGTVLESVNITLDGEDLKNTPSGVVLEKGGDLTEAVFNDIADRLAAQVANRLTDVLFPAKVAAVTGSRVSVNRGDGTGIAVGQVWEVFATGEAITDPDTGEVLGAAETPVGFIRIVQVLPKLSTGEVCGENLGIATGCIVRKTDRTTCGAAADPLDRPARMFMPVQDAKPAQAVAEKRRVAAIFVRNREPRIDDARVSVLEDFLVAGLDDTCFDTMSREDTLNSVAKFAKSGPNAGAPLDPVKDLDKILSNDASARQLAQMMGADYVLVASITALSIEQRKTRDAERGIATDVTTYTLDATYRILDRADGSSIASGSAMATDAVRQGGGVTIERDMVTGLLRDSAAKMAAAMRKRCETKGLRAPGALAEATLDIKATPSDLAVPDIVKDEKGNWTVASSPYRLEATGFLVELDGVVVGSTPTRINATPGLHRLRITRPDFETFEKQVNIGPNGSALEIAMRATTEGLARWRSMSSFLQGLKQDQQLTDAQVKVLEGYAEFFRNSKFSIDHKSDHKSDIKSDIKVDTKEAPVFQERSLWHGVILREK